MSDPIAHEALITDPYLVFVFLIVLTGCVFGLSEWKPLKKFFRYVSPILFVYFLPMVATTLGILPSTSPAYALVNKAFLPAVLVLVLVSSDLLSIFRLGFKAIGVMLLGSVGVMVGAVLSYCALGGATHFGEWGWACFGALSASWIGGSSNMLAVKGAFDIPDIAPLLLVDSVLVYSWMGMLVVLTGFQRPIDRFFRVDEKVFNTIQERVSGYVAEEARPISTTGLMVMLALAFGLGAVCSVCGTYLYKEYITPLSVHYPSVKSMTGFTITIILVTLFGIVLSFTPARKLEKQGASSVGYALLYLLLPTFGAQADLRVLGDVHWYFMGGVIILLVHGIFIIIGMRLLRAPLFLGATGSQANLGGPASASIVAGAYQPALMPVGILLGVLGTVLGTYLGLIVAYICRALG